MFRVAEFKRTANGQRFKGFRYNGYRLTCEGVLYKGKNKANTTDKRRSGYCELNRGVERQDLNGVYIYERDLVRAKREKVTGPIVYDPKKGAFILYVKNGLITIPYSFLDCYDVSLEIIGNDYENLVKNKLFRG